MNTTAKTDLFVKVMISMAVMLVAVLEVMDITIVNVALPNMMGALSANAEQISWVLTAYIVSSAIIMLLTGFLVDIMGRRRLIIISVIGFMLSSCLCGMSDSLTQIVFFRALQGVFGATLVPLSQYILFDTFPAEKRGVAMAVWGMGIMVAPVFGPTLGGIITDSLNWRWTFYINVPISLIALAMCLRYIEETPRIKKTVDTMGLLLMAAGVGALQIFLDQGNNYNWFDSDGILLLFVTTILLLTVFIIRGWSTPNHIINLHLYRDRNFAVANVIIAVFCCAVFGVIMLQPLMLEGLLNYTPKLAGFVLAPRGLACAISLFFVAKLIEMVDERFIVTAGLLFCALGSWVMSHYSLSVDVYWIVIGSVIQGFGMGMVFVPITTLATLTLKQNQIAEATGLFNFSRSLGTSIGISMLITVYSRLAQVNWQTLGGHVRPNNPHVHLWLDKLDLTLESPLAPHVLGYEIHRQADMLAFIDSYHVTTLLFLGIIPMLLLIRHKAHKKPSAGLQRDEGVESR